MKHDFNTLHLLWSIRNIPSTELNCLEKLILFTILSCAGSKNNVWYNQDSLQEMTCIVRNTLRKHLRSLVEKKYIIKDQPQKYFRTSSNQYQLNIEQIMIYCPLKKGSTDDPFCDNKGSNDDPLNYRKGSNGDRKGSNGDTKRGQDLTLKKEREERKKNARVRASSEAPSRSSEEVTCKVLPGGYKVYSNVMKDFIDEMHEEWAREDLEKNKSINH